MNAMRTAGDRAGRGRRRAAAAAALLALAAGCDAGRTGRGQIQVTTVPEGAQIECNGRRYDSSPVAIHTSTLSPQPETTFAKDVRI